MWREIGIAGVIVELVHGFSSRLKRTGAADADYAVNPGYPHFAIDARPQKMHAIR
jgi:hypothetical protein